MVVAKVKQKNIDRRKKTRIIAAILFFVIAVYVVFTAVQIISFGKKDNACRSDVIIVLGSEVFGKKPSPVFEQRILHGISLYKDGFADRILFTGGKTNGQPVAEAEVAREYAIRAGIPEKAIWLEEQSQNTRENFCFSGTIMKEYGFESAIVVSDPYHLMRAMLIADDQDIEACSSPTPTSMVQGFGEKFKFLLREVTMLTIYRVVSVFF